jgi:hypothetical protein
MTTVRTPTGMLMAKIQRQLASSLSSPPSGGPRAAATDATAPQRPMTGAHWRGGKLESSRP